LKRPSLFLATLWLAAFPMAAAAETHDVLVEDNMFIPNDITINIGDTVRWTNAIGGAPHDVTEDNRIWFSETSASFTYSRTFNSAEEILYYCSVHSSPGRNRNVSMNGRVVVVGEDVASFQINAGLNDAWYNPATAGQGILISVFPEIQQLFLAWFTFDIERPPEDVTAMLGDPGHRWLTAQGPYDGNTANLTIFVTEGGVFDSAEPAASTDPDGDGTMNLEFADCTEGLVNYEITSLGISGEIPIQRIVQDNVPLCEALANP